MADTTHSITPSRRAILGAAIAGPAIAAIGIPAAAAPRISPTLADLIEAHRRANVALDRWYAEVFNPIVDRDNAAIVRHREAVASIPHVTESGGVSMAGTPVTFCSSKGYSRDQAKHYLEMDAKEPNRSDSWTDLIATARQYIAAEDQRNAKIEALGPEPKSSWSLDDENRATAPLLNAAMMVHACAVTTLHDLQAKLAWIENEDCGMDGEPLMKMVQADVARILAAREA